MAGETVRVKGYRELIRSLQFMDRAVAAGIRAELRNAARLVQAEAQRLFSPVDPKSAGGYRVVVRTRSVAVEQSLRRTTGRHPEWGKLQMRTALLPALEQHEPEVVRRLESMLDGIAGSAGF